MLILAWGLVTVALIGLVIYRGTLLAQQDYEVAVAGGDSLYQEQVQGIIAKTTRLRSSIIGFSILSGALLLASAAFWIYFGWSSF